MGRAARKQVQQTSAEVTQSNKMGDFGKTQRRYVQTRAASTSRISRREVEGEGMEQGLNNSTWLMGMLDDRGEEEGLEVV